jgi:PleD family two-component response regulator
LSEQEFNNNNNPNINNNKTRRKILIVDDEQDILTGFKRSLEDTGLFEVDTFVDPQLALSKFSKVGLNYYDLLLIDIKMPQMNGFELYQEIKNKIETAGQKQQAGIANHIKVCFITAHEIYYEKLKKEFPTLNVDVGCFIKKPIEEQDLVDRIKQELKL